MIKKARSIVKHNAAAKHIALEISYNEMARQHLECLRALLGDEQRLTQILTNLLSNSLKFSQKDSKVIIGINLF